MDKVGCLIFVTLLIRSTLQKLQMISSRVLGQGEQHAHNPNEIIEDG